MAAWKIAPALAAGNCTVIKPASQTPLTLLMFAELTADILPPGVLNVVTDPGRTVGQAIAANPRSEEHTSELQSLMRTSYAVFCLKQKTTRKKQESKRQSRKITNNR